MFISTPSELGNVEEGRKEILPKSGKPNLLRLGLHRTDAGLSPASHISMVTGGALSHKGGREYLTYNLSAPEVFRFLGRR